MEYHHINSGRKYSIIYSIYRIDRKLHLPHGDYIDKSLKEEVSAMFKNRTPDGTNNIAGIRVTELRKGLRISQRELATMCNMPQSSVARIESLKTTRNLDTIFKLFEPLGLALTVSMKKV